MLAAPEAAAGLVAVATRVTADAGRAVVAERAVTEPLAGGFTAPGTRLALPVALVATRGAVAVAVLVAGFAPMVDLRAVVAPLAEALAAALGAAAPGATDLRTGRAEVGRD